MVSWGTAGLGPVVTSHIRKCQSNSALNKQGSQVKSRIGVDISKAKFDVALLLEGGKYRSKVFSNEVAGFKAFAEWMNSNVAAGAANVHVCMEATGSYHEGLALFLHDAGVEVSVVNPMLV